MEQLSPRPALRLVAVNDDDASLISRTQAGDQQAFAELYMRHARHVADVVYRLTGNNDILDDVVQETFVLAADRLGDLKDHGSLRSWLVTIAVRKVRRHLARQAFHRTLMRAFGEAMPRQAAHAMPDAAVDAHGVLGQLPDSIRIPWVLHRVEGASLPDVAAACEVSLATVKRRIAQAEQRLEKLTHAAR